MRRRPSVVHYWRCSVLPICRAQHSHDAERAVLYFESGNCFDKAISGVVHKFILIFAVRFYNRKSADLSLPLKK